MRTKVVFEGKFAAIPPHTQTSLHQWIERGIMPSDFLSCVLMNDLFGAFGHADLSNRAALPLIAEWIRDFAGDVRVAPGQDVRDEMRAQLRKISSAICAEGRTILDEDDGTAP
jgi:hypothetical protein